MSTKSCITNIIIVDDGASKWLIIDNLHVNVKKQKCMYGSAFNMKHKNDYI